MILYESEDRKLEAFGAVAASLIFSVVVIVGMAVAFGVWGSLR